MKKKYRLLKFRDFSKILSEGERISSNSLICFWKSNSYADNIKIGIIIPKKKCKLSCDRKYLKRLFWAINANHNIHLFPKITCVIMYRDYFFDKFRKNQIVFSKLQEEYLFLLKRIESRIS